MTSDKHPSRVPIATRIDRTLADELDALHRETYIPKARLMDEALRLLLLKYRPRRSRRHGIPEHHLNAIREEMEDALKDEDPSVKSKFVCKSVPLGDRR